MKILLYCTKAKPYLNDYRLMENCNRFVIMNKAYNSLNGKIVAECDFEVEEIEYQEMFVDIFDEYEEIAGTDIDKEYYPKALYPIDLQDKSCLSFEELDNYLKGKNGYAIHIKNLNIFDKPRFLEGFDDNKGHTLRKAPQNMCKVLRVNVGEYDYKDLNSNAYESYILISIKPEDLCKILNGEKTIEVKKKVLREMIK